MHLRKGSPAVKLGTVGMALAAALGTVTPLVSPVAAAAPHAGPVPRVVDCRLVPTSMVRSYLAVAAGPGHQVVTPYGSIECSYAVGGNNLAVQVDFTKGPFSSFQYKEHVYVVTSGSAMVGGVGKAAFTDSSVGGPSNVAYSSLFLWARGFEVDLTAQSVTLGRVVNLARAVVARLP